MRYEHDQTLALPTDEFDSVISAPTPAQPQANTFGLIAPPDRLRADEARRDEPASRRDGSTTGELSSSLRPRSRRRKRSVPLDWVALVLAFLAPPVGLIAGLTALILESRRNGWASPVAKVATSIAVVTSLALAGVLVVLDDLAKKEQAYAGIVESSRAFCAALTASPGVLESDTFGWPTPGSTVTESLAAMVEYEAFWLGVAEVAPEGVQPEATLIATAARSVISSVEASRIMDAASDRELMRSVAGDSRIPAWSEQYCE